MDALTSFELEAQRRRETVANDRDQAWARAQASAEDVDVQIVERRIARRSQAPSADCQPAPLARNAAG